VATSAAAEQLKVYILKRETEKSAAGTCAAIVDRQNDCQKKTFRF
jgi:hypothetical protein